MAVAALKAGKHVLVEKPIALETAAADRMVAAARDADRLLMVGHVLPFFPEFAYLAAAIRGGEYGKLLGGQFKRVISRPDWSSAIGDVAQTGGPAIDLHIHDTHFIRVVCGLPKQVFASGRVEGEAVVHLTTQYLYGAGGPCVGCVSGALAQSGRPFVHGFEVYLERATLVFESGSQPLTVRLGSVATARGRRMTARNATGIPYPTYRRFSAPRRLPGSASVPTLPTIGTVPNVRLTRGRWGRGNNGHYDRRASAIRPTPASRWRRRLSRLRVTWDIRVTATRLRGGVRGGAVVLPGEGLRFSHRRL
jgi:hypothetical protein